jgi:arylsulfatase A-like enzyme
MTQLSRRDFLKIAGTTFAGLLTPERLLSLRAANNNQSPNIIIILWDAFSAEHLSLYGYPRLTTPNIDAFAGYSTVFHNHYSGGNFTTTGTASMLTGMLPWKHRAINYGGLVRSEFVHSNPYTLLGNDYFRFAFSQNPWPDRLMGQYHQDVDRFLPPSAYSLLQDAQPMEMFNNDRALASIAMEDFLLPAQEKALAGSSLLGYLNKSRILNNANKKNLAYSNNGIPEIMDPGYLIPYLNENIYDGVLFELSSLADKEQPYFAYFHLYSPHYPYRPHDKYRHLFQGDGYRPVKKPVHPLALGLTEDYMNTQRDLYDRQIAQIDDEFGKLISQLDRNGILQNSYIIFTSDHGELFERGFTGHGFQLMYEPVLRIPLIIHAPGQVKRQNIFTLTSNVDILPTILSLAGKETAPDMDGKILPGFGGQADEDRPIFSVVAVDNSAFGVIKKAVISMRKHAYKLIVYLGYDNKMSQPFELYNLENDPEELNNLATTDANTLSVMKNELFAYIDEANKPFARN